MRAFICTKTVKYASIPEVPGPTSDTIMAPSFGVLHYILYLALPGCHSKLPWDRIVFFVLLSAYSTLYFRCFQSSGWEGNGMKLLVLWMDSVGILFHGLL